MPMAEAFFGRRDEMSRLQSFVDSDKSGFLVLCGRRRHPVLRPISTLRLASA